MARQELWIIADNDNADKTLKLHQLKGLSTSEITIASWYIFSSFDITTQTSKAIGNAFQQIENGLLKTMSERPRLPHSIIILLGDSFLNDTKLCYNPNNLFEVLHCMFRQLKRQVLKFTELLPQKAKPIQDIKFFVTKPLPKPERFFRSRMYAFHKLSKQRHTYNDQFIKALHAAGMSFINAGISTKDGNLFNKTTSATGRENFILSLEGLRTYWESISWSLEKLHKGAIGLKTEQEAADLRCVTIQEKRTPEQCEQAIEQYFTHKQK